MLVALLVAGWVLGGLVVCFLVAGAIRIAERRERGEPDPAPAPEASSRRSTSA